MFERFTDDARSVVLTAVQAAELGNDARVGVRHLLSALLRDVETRSILAASNLGPSISEPAARPGADEPGDDEALLASLGIDLEAVRREIDGVFGPGAFDAARRRGREDGFLPVRRRRFDQSAKTALERSLRHALRLGCTSIGPCHLALAVLDDDGIDLTATAERGHLEQAVAELEQIAFDRYRTRRRWWGLRAG